MLMSIPSFLLDVHQPSKVSIVALNPQAYASRAHPFTKRAHAASRVLGLAFLSNLKNAMKNAMCVAMQ